MVNRHRLHSLARSVAILLALSATALTVSSCRNPIDTGEQIEHPADSETPDRAEPTATLSLTLTAADRARTIAPVVDMEIADYDVTGVGPDGATFERLDVAGTTLTVDALATGVWTITAEAKNAAGTVIGRGSASIDLATEGDYSVTITVTALSTPGSASITLDWPDDVLASPAIAASLARSVEAPSRLPSSFPGRRRRGATSRSPPDGTS